VSSAFWIWSHLSFVLLAANFLLLMQQGRRGPRARWASLSVLAFLGLLPVGHTDVSGFMLAHTGTLCVPILILMFRELLAAEGLVPSQPLHIQRNTNLFWLAGGVLLYPAALGFVAHDTYYFGYNSLMGWCVLGLSCVAMLCRHQVLGICLAATVLAHQLGLQESPNLWDYLIDPWLWIAAASQLIWMRFKPQPQKIHANFVTNGPPAMAILPQHR